MLAEYPNTNGRRLLNMNGNNQGLVVMYHYVLKSREDTSDGIRPLFADEFEIQLDWLEENYRVMTPDDLLSSIDNGWPSSEKPPCMLTFDDGTRDHWSVVTPILKRRSMTGLFFVLTWPSELSRMPITHAVHWIMGRPEEEVWAQLQELTNARLGGTEILGTLQEAEGLYYRDTGIRARIKYAINFALPTDLSAEIVSDIAQSQGKSLEQITGEWFVGEQEIKSMAADGMEIGMHGRTHLSASILGADGMSEELITSSSYLAALLGKAPSWFSWPYGNSDLGQAVREVYQTCRDLGVRGIATTQQAFVTTQTDLFAVPRYDCVCLPPRSNEVIEDLTQSK